MFQFYEKIPNVKLQSLLQLLMTSETLIYKKHIFGLFRLKNFFVKENGFHHGKMAFIMGFT